MSDTSLSIDLVARFAQATDAFESLGKKGVEVSNRLDSAFNMVKFGAGMLIGVTSLKSAFDSLLATANTMAELDENATRAGTSVENLSELMYDLMPAGKGLEEITEMAGRLVRGLNKGEEAAGKAAKAFKALGIDPFQDGKMRDPVELIRELSGAFSEYADSAATVALLQDALGRGGQTYGALLRDLADAQRMNIKITSEQQAEAEKLKKTIGEFKREFELFKQGIVVYALPGLKDLIEQFRVGMEAAGGFWSAVFRFGASPSSWMGAEANVKRLLEEQRDLQSKIALPNGKNMNDAIRASTMEKLAQVQKDLVYYQMLLRQRTELVGPPGTMAGGPKKTLDYEVGNDSETKKTAAEKAYEAQTKAIDQYIKRLIDQKDRVEELTEVEKILADEERNQIAWQDSAQRDKAFALAREIDNRKTLKAAVEAELKVEEQALAVQIEALQIADRMQRARLDEIERFRQMADPQRQYVVQLERIYELQDELMDSQGTFGKLVASVWKKMAEANGEVVDQAKEAKSAMQELGFTMSSAFEDAMFSAKSLGDIVKGLLLDIGKLAFRKNISDPMASWWQGLFNGGDKVTPLSSDELSMRDLVISNMLAEQVDRKSAPSLTFNIDSRTDQAWIMNQLGATVDAAITKSASLQRRGWNQ